jgi:predicted secreted hydrolase
MKKFFLIAAAGIVAASSISAYAKLPYFPVSFPRDDAAHHENVPYPVTNFTEWWYFNGKLVSAEGRKFAYFVAVFHLDMPEAKRSSASMRAAVLMVQITDIDRQKVYGNTMIYTDDDAIFSSKELNIQLSNDLSLWSNGQSYYLTEAMQPNKGPALKFNLAFTPTKAPLLINKNGLIDMWDDTNSYYYSNTRLKTMGTIQIDNDVYSVNPDDSSSWMDHQWGDFTLNTDKAQWIWTSSQLDNGMDLSVFELINPDTKEPIWGLANVIMPDNSRAYTRQIKITPSMAYGGNSKYPLSYQVAVKPLHLQLTLDAMARDQNSNGFWEGIHDVTGLYKGNVVKGYAFVENTVNY